MSMLAGDPESLLLVTAAPQQHIYAIQQNKLAIFLTALLSCLIKFFIAENVA